jgi:O-antigen/teichoic acid export membrane protein
MYKPVAENDVRTVDALLNFYRKAYAVVGTVILTVGICLIPFLDKLVKGSYPEDINIVLLYIVYLLNASISYFMYAYRSSLIVVYQREDINSVTNMIVTVLLMVCQISILFLTNNYMLFAVMQPIFTVANNLRIAFVVKKMFPQYKCEGRISHEIIGELKKKVSGTVIVKISQMTRNSFDSICVSAFIGLSETAIYNNYYYVIRAVTSILSIFSNSIMGGVGNHVVLKTKDENFNELKKIDFIYMNISGWCTVFILCLIQPFMELWMGSGMLLPMSVVILLCIYFYFLKIGDMLTVYSSTNGLWWEYRFWSVTEILLNISLNILLAKYYGLHGIVIATIFTIFGLNLVVGPIITFKNYFGIKRLKEYWTYQTIYFLVTFTICLITYTLCSLITVGDVIQMLCVRFAVCLLIPGVIYTVIYGRTKYFKYAVDIVFNRK